MNYAPRIDNREESSCISTWNPTKWRFSWRVATWITRFSHDKTVLIKPRLWYTKTHLAYGKDLSRSRTNTVSSVHISSSYILPPQKSRAHNTNEFLHPNVLNLHVISYPLILLLFFFPPLPFITSGIFSSPSFFSIPFHFFIHHFSNLFSIPDRSFVVEGPFIRFLLRSITPFEILKCNASA